MGPAGWERLVLFPTPRPPKRRVGSRAGQEGTQGLYSNPPLRSCGFLWPGPASSGWAGATACVSGCQAELYELKNQIPSFLGYLTVCLGRPGDYW